MNVRKAAVAIGLAASLLGGLAACATSSETPTTPDCVTVIANYDTAHAEAVKAKEDAQAAYDAAPKDTPDESQAAANLDAATNKVAQIESAKATCDASAAAASAASTTTSTSTPTAATGTVIPASILQAISLQDACTGVELDGKTVDLPAVGGCAGNATSVPVGPMPSYQSADAPPLTQTGYRMGNWCHLTALLPVEQYGWYWEGAQRTAGVSFEQAQQYCDMQKRQPLDFRAIIVVGGYNITDDEARELATKDGIKGVYHTDGTALPVIRYNSIINTRGLENQQMNEFVDSRSMVRVSLMAPIIDDKGTADTADDVATGLSPERGIFDDCTNAWRLPVKTYPVGKPELAVYNIPPAKNVPPTSTAPSTAPPPATTIPPATTPSTNTVVTTTPSTTVVTTTPSTSTTQTTTTATESTTTPTTPTTPTTETSKPPQSWDCMQNAGPGCPPNPAHQDPQVPRNDAQSSALEPVPGVTEEPQPLEPWHPEPSDSDGSDEPAGPPSTAASNGYDPGSGPDGSPGTMPGGAAGPTDNPGSSVLAPNPDPDPGTPTALQSDPVQTAGSGAVEAPH